MTTEDMKMAWAETSRRLDRLERTYSDMREEAINGKRRTALDDLALRYRRFSTISLIFVLISPIYAINGVFDGSFRIWVPLGMALYFGLASVMDWWLYKRVKQIDVATMTTEDVVSASAFCRKRHLQFMMVLIPLMLVLVGAFIAGCLNQEYMIYAIVGGAILGLILGVRQLINFMDDYRIIKGDQK